MSNFYISMNKSDVVVGKVMDETLAKKIGLEIVPDGNGHDAVELDYSGDDYDSEGNCLLHYIRLGEKLHLNDDGKPTFTVTTDVFIRNDIPDEEAIDWEDAWDYDSTYDDDDDYYSLKIYIEDED